MNLYSKAVGDFNGDGRQDLAVANHYIARISILLSNCIEVRTRSQITPTETTCSQFSSGTADTLGSVQYDRSNGLMPRVDPRNFLYWVTVTARAGDNIFTTTQTITTGNFNTFFAAIANGSMFDCNCVTLESKGWQDGGTVAVEFNAPSAGTYYIAIKFNGQNLSGQSAPNPGSTVRYDFTTGVLGLHSGLDLVKH
ncbi:MAG TPA: hypothetical protein VFQ78_05445 [Candidatus Udaeobacter sp.]|jgi:hypothetical protein|nr:hypothetical protein [Candidatus Udaeobacter sp.]